MYAYVGVMNKEHVAVADGIRFRKSTMLVPFVYKYTRYTTNTCFVQPHLSRVI